MIIASLFSLTHANLFGAEHDDDGGICFGKDDALK